ncbi:MAG: hypothetical protein ACLF0P_10850 [Thermoanaerobaculia bacterium]
MKGAVRLLCRPGTAAGLGLTGLAPVLAADAAEAAGRLPGLLADEATALVLVEEILLPPAAGIPRPGAGSSAFPVVLPFPAPSWTAPAAAAETWVAEILRRAVGYRVRLR